MRSNTQAPALCLLAAECYPRAGFLRLRRNLPRVRCMYVLIEEREACLGKGREVAKCWACRACAVATRQDTDGAHAQCQVTVQQYKAMADRPLPCLAPLASHLALQPSSLNRNAG